MYLVICSLFLRNGSATTTYGAILCTKQYIHNLPPHPKISNIMLAFPTTHAAVLDDFRAHLQALPWKPNQKVVVVIIDSIVSNPGCLLTWEQMVQICKEENVLSIVDAAHSIGKEVGLNLGQTSPDFWVSEAWLKAKIATRLTWHRTQEQCNGAIL